MFKQFRFSVSTEREEHSIMAATDEKTGKQPPRPNDDADKKSPNYRSQQSPRSGQPVSADDGDCHTAKPSGPPASAAENHEAANQKCDVGAPKTASKDQREKATG
jgi:hypothetical protein